MSFCKNCGKEFDVDPKEMGWEKCPYCGAPLGFACKNCGKEFDDDPKEMGWEKCPYCGTPFDESATTTDLKFAKDDRLILASSIAAIVGACILDWGESVLVGSVKLWDMTRICSYLTQAGKYAGSVSSSASSSASSAAGLIFFVLFVAIIGVLMVGWGAVLFARSPGEKFARDCLFRGNAVLGVDALVWLIALGSISSSVNNAVNSYTSYVTSSRVSVVSVSAGPFIVLACCAAAMILLRKGKKD
ncbi:MAG: hypothetical protein WAY93_02805 [Atopobiaceae bacterium]|jgi:DNA-directed RNA polymerase subunit RPC12/RpoP